jgi:hypothetical protein
VLPRRDDVARGPPNLVRTFLSACRSLGRLFRLRLAPAAFQELPLARNLGGRRGLAFAHLGVGSRLLPCGDAGADGLEASGDALETLRELEDLGAHAGAVHLLVRVRL